MKEKSEVSPSQFMSKLYETGGEAVDYAEDVFELSTVDVQIENCRSPFIKSLPPELSRAFDKLSSPADKIVSLDLKLAYDRGESLFKPNEINLHLDNKYTVVFARTSLNAKREHKAESSLFYPLLLTPRGKPAIKRDEVKLLDEASVYEILNELGIDIPTSPQRAEWKAIENILRFSGKWTAQSEHSTVLDLYSRLRVEDKVVGVGMTDMFDTETDQDNNGAEDRVREVDIDIERSNEPMESPTRALRFSQFVDGNSKVRRFGGMRNIPIRYEPEFLGQPAEFRVELGEGEEIIPDVDILQFIRQSIFTARQDLNR